MSSDSVFDKHLREQEIALERSQRAARRRNMLILALALVALIFGLVCMFLAMDNSRLASVNAVYGQTQQQEKQSLAEEFDAACKTADFQQTPAGENICRKAQQVASEPGTPLTGPQGIQGAQGPRGEQGFPGAAGPAGPTGPKGDPGVQGVAGLLGLAGSAGSNGLNGSPGTTGPAGPPGATGHAGPAGANGADSTVPGPAGPQGPTGPQGPEGESGRGIQSAVCAGDGRWVITYTDGATQDGGQCRETLLGATP
ncbi:hypothetical protein QE394_001093 [Arthrobacter sp. SORGH_AS 212]|uniref:hypothetical protein n=1 Tax=Pseudarthrobacter sp. SORGH_AS 212 TaxID=3041777 RepID=UPI002785D38C|nr:hypothetical protein [Arthrobacter sp. SORGH_AS_0212]